MRRFLIFFLLGLIGSSSEIFAQERSVHSETLSLIRVYELAKKNDTQLKAAEAQWLSVRELLSQSAAVLVPNISLNANTLYNQSEDINRQTFRYHSRAYALTLSQPVFNFSAFASRREATHRVKAAALSYMAAQQDLILRVVTAYNNVLLAEDTLSFKKEEQAAFNEQLKNAKVRFRVGVISATPLYEAQASVDQTRASVIAAEHALENTRAQLYLMIQTPVESIKRFRSVFSLSPPNPQSELKWIEFAKEHNVEYLNSQYRMKAAGANVAVQTGAHLPVVNIVANNTHNITGFNGFAGGLNTRTRNIGLQLSIPIFSGGSVLSQTRQAKFQYDKAIAENEGALRQVQLDVEESYREVFAGIEKIKADDATLRSIALALHYIQLEYQAGKRTIADVLMAQENQFSAKVQRAFDRYHYIHHTLILKRVAGSLCEADVVALDRWLVDPQDGSRKKEK